MLDQLWNESLQLMKGTFNSRCRAQDGDIPLLPLHVPKQTPPSPLSGVQKPTQSSPYMASSLQPNESLLALARQTSHLQEHIQTLLDAQSEGLLAGLGAQANENASESSSRTPTPSASEAGSRIMYRPPAVVPVRQPRSKKIGLRAARRGISRAIADLSVVKANESQVLEAEVSNRSVAISSADRLSNKASALQSKVDTIESAPTSEQIAHLKGTEKSLDSEIHELETRLFEMKARQRHMLREISSIENSVQSQLSSYRNALQLAEQEAREFLARPPPELDVSFSRLKEEGLWALPPQRRTLELAKNEWNEEQMVLESRKEDVIREKDALDDGGKVWDNVRREIGEVEALLQAEMKTLKGAAQPQPGGQGMKIVLNKMKDAQDYLRKQLEVAEEKHWTLLTACVGAELEALSEGQVVLEEALGPLESRATQHERSDNNIEDPSIFANQDLSNGTERPTGRFEDVDDRPGSDLLVSQDYT